MNEMAKSPWKAGVLLLVVFIAGALVGGAVMRFHPPMGPGRDPNGLVKHLTDELDLSQTQQDSIKAVLDRWKPVMDSVWSDVRPRIETVRARIRSDIAAQLTADQKAKYDEMIRRHAEEHSAPPPRR